ncbi:hypothetical protein Tco_0904472 [Tanacetum coccineum]
MHEKFQMSSIGELTFFLELTFFFGLQVQQKKDGIFISQDKYVDEILKKFGFTEVKTASTPMETQKPLLKDEDGEEVDVHMYRSMIGSLMYLTSSRPDIMFVVCACARYQVNPKVSHLYAIKRIFRLISWQCKKQTVVANSTTKAKYVAASSCCGQVLWIQNQLLDYGLFAKVKTINGEAQLHALVDGKKIIVTEASVRRDLQLADEEGVECLPNSTIFEQLALMGYEKCLSPKTTAWNEFSSTMASAIICLATNQKFNFSKFIFESMIRNLDNLSGKFLMYPRLRLFHKELGDSFGGAAILLLALKAMAGHIADDATTVSAATTTTATIIIVDDITLASTYGNKKYKTQGHMNKKDLIRLDEEVALKLQAEFDEEEILAREKAEKKKNPILP